MSVTSAESFAFSPENPAGKKGGGTAKINDKPSPLRMVGPGETITMAEIDGPGKIEHLWIGGTISRHFILRFYWDHQEHPSVEVPISAYQTLPPAPLKPLPDVRKMNWR